MRITGFLSRPYRIYGLTDLSHQCVYCWKGPYSSVKRLGRLSGRAIDASCSRYCSTAQTFNKVGLGHRFDLVVLTNTRLGPVFFCILEVRTRETAAWMEFAARSSLRLHVMFVRRLC